MNNTTVTFTNLTPAQAKTLAEWYAEQGEQDADIWFDENCDDRAPLVKNITADADGKIYVSCR